MPKGKLKECDCGGPLRQTFETLDLEEYQSDECETVYTLYHVVKKWPKGQNSGEGKERSRGGFSLSGHPSIQPHNKTINGQNAEIRV